MPNPRWTYDRKLAKGRCGVVGVDEAGRGCLAGPVVAGCVILPSEFFREAKNRKRVEEINDSKKFTEEKRENLFLHIQNLLEECDIYGATGMASVEEIEDLNIVGATCLAMQRAMELAARKSNDKWTPSRLKHEDLFSDMSEPQSQWTVLVDGKPMRKLIYQHFGLVKGDTISLSVAMASLMAKVTRDRMMRELNSEFPGYGFSANKGYGAPVHLEALRKYGPTPQHRPRFLRNLFKDKRDPMPKTFEQTQLSLA